MNNNNTEEVIDIVEENEYVVNQPAKERGPWKVFAIIGYIIGIVSLVSIFIPFAGAGMAVDGIIMSALGKKSESKRHFAKKGLTFSIVACAVNFVISIIIYVIYFIFILSHFE